MNETSTAVLDRAAFERVWRRVMPEDRPDCPFSLEEPILTPPAVPQPLVRPALAPALLSEEPQSVPCLGEASVGELPGLEALMDQTFQAQREFRVLERRAGRRGGFAALAQAKGRQLRRLNAAYFLISGRDYTPSPAAGGALPQNIPMALRQRFRGEQSEAAALMEAAQATADPCLSQLYRELAEENRAMADQVRQRLEQR